MHRHERAEIGHPRPMALVNPQGRTHRGLADGRGHRRRVQRRAAGATVLGEGGRAARRGRLGGGDARGHEERAQAGRDLGVGRRHVVLLAGVVRQVVELDLAALADVADHGPVALAEGLLQAEALSGTAVDVFRVEALAQLTPRAGEERQERDAVGVGGRGQAGGLGEGGHPASLVAREIEGLAGFDGRRPAHHRGLAQTALIAPALHAAQGAVGVQRLHPLEAGGLQILARGAVVGGEDNQRILVQPAQGQEVE